MTKRKKYTFNATIKKRECTEEDKMIKDKAIELYIDKLLELKGKQEKELV